MELTMADWTGLPSDILGLLAERLELLENYHRFRAVCRSWRSLTPPEKKPNFSLRFPGVMLLITNDQEPADANALLFHSLLTTEARGIDLPAGRRLLVAYPGWILTMGFDFDISFLHPLTREQVSLPPMLTFRDQYEYDQELTPESVVYMFVRKAVASTDPKEEGCVVLAIYGEFRIPAFARPGDNGWTNIDTVGHLCFDDAVYFEGRFYVVDCHGAVFRCDLEDRVATKILPRIDELGVRDSDQKYIVESEGVLLVVCRRRAGELYSWEAVLDPQMDDTRVYLTVGFRVFKVETTTRDDNNNNDSSSLAEVFDLGDRALFVGYNQSVSMKATTTGGGGIRSNCIYFSEDNTELYGGLRDGGGHDTGIYDMETGSVVEWIYAASKFKHPLSPPVWYLV